MTMDAVVPETAHSHDVVGETDDLTRLQHENSVLRTWLIGVIEECEGCREQAVGWLTMTSPQAEQEAPE